MTRIQALHQNRSLLNLIDSHRRTDSMFTMHIKDPVKLGAELDAPAREQEHNNLPELPRIFFEQTSNALGGGVSGGRFMAASLCSLLLLGRKSGPI